LKRQRLIAGTILGVMGVLVVTMTTASHLSDRNDPQTARQLAIQEAHEDAWRREPFTPEPMTLVETAASSAASGSATGGQPDMYIKFCASCHGPKGEGGQQGRLKFPPLLDVSTKPRRTADDIVALLKDPAAYDLQPPMRSFSNKLTEPQMREISEWIVKLKK
jgi:mono/diheme cytochrome c family protein